MTSDTATPVREHEGEDVRPVVRRAGASNVGLWVFAAATVLGGYFVFSLMSERRTAIVAPRTSALAENSNGTMVASPPPLALPQSYYTAQEGQRYYPEAMPSRSALPNSVPSSTRAIATTPSPRPAPAIAPPELQMPPLPLRQVQPSVIFSNGQQGTPPAAGTAKTSEGADRVRAGRLANPGFTVPQGTVIPAVLETALDSTRPGGVRALVQRDIFGFDGSQILIPRGSRLYGEYDAELDSGQKRAKVRWTRLLRPDGVTIALDSPASDPLGRAGIRGKVDSKFFQRFGSALLQSVLNVGVGYAASKATDGVIVALPGSTANVQVQDGNRIKPTLSVRQGTSVSVFVARDLDFSGVGY